jgi:hypothetical protein
MEAGLLKLTPLTGPGDGKGNVRPRGASGHFRGPTPAWRAQFPLVLRSKRIQIASRIPGRETSFAGTMETERAQNP